MASSAPDPLSLNGVTLADKYLVEGMVAEGGFSFVYRAQHQVWKQSCVLKFLKGAEELDAVEREKVVAALLQEGILLRELSSRAAAILQAHDMGTWESPGGDSYPYLVLEWLDGVTLRQAIRQARKMGVAPLTMVEALQLFAPVAQALTATHRRGIAHRDLKPENLFLCGALRDPEAYLKVLDFGVAKVLSQTVTRPPGDRSAQRSQTAFTPWYGAPEQFMQDHGSTGPWTDVFALALIMVETMTFRRALSGDDVTGLALASIHPMERPTPRHKGLTVTDAVETVFARALAVDIGERYQSLGEFWNELLLALDFPSLDLAPLSSESLPGRISRLPGRGSLPPEVASGSVVATSGVIRPSSVSFVNAPTASSTPEPSSSLSPSASPGAAPGGSPGVSPVTPVAAVLGVPAVRPGRTSPWLLGAGLVGLVGVLAVAWVRRPVVAVTASAASAARSAGLPTGQALAAAASLAPAPAPPCPAGMVRIPGGDFYMGYDGEDATPGERPVHPVKLGAFCMDVTEVTVDAYRACSDDGKCMRAHATVRWPGVTPLEVKTYGPLCNIDDAGRDRHPINCVDWEMASNYCERHSKRLPTSAEWEFAVRGPDGRTYPWGDEPPDGNRLNACGQECLDWGKRLSVPGLVAMHDQDDGFPTTAPVGSFPKGRSRYGLDDVIGNVMEWVQDWNGPYTAASSTELAGPATGTERVIRGGAWNAGHKVWVRPSFRFQLPPQAVSHGVGFRCASAAR